MCALWVRKVYLYPSLEKEGDTAPGIHKRSTFELRKRNLGVAWCIEVCVHRPKIEAFNCVALGKADPRGSPVSRLVYLENEEGQSK